MQGFCRELCGFPVRLEETKGNKTSAERKAGDEPF